MKRPRLHPLISAVVLAAAASLSLPSFAGSYSSLVVFGDSLSDDGNNAAAGLYSASQVITGNTYIPTYAYAAGDYSNGPVWATYLASSLGVSLSPSLTGGTDFAFGGARMATAGVGPGGFPYSLLTQASMYLASTQDTASASALYVIAGGGDDARDAVAAIAGGANPGTTETTVATSFASNVLTMVDELEAAGAQHIIVWDTPNIGLSPAALATPGASALGSSVASAMNTALDASLAGNADVSIFDIYGLSTSIASNPGKYGFSDDTDACGAVTGANCSQYEYWDGIHPTTAAHQLIAEGIYALAVPEPGTWALMAMGLGVVAYARRRVSRDQPAGSVAA